MASARFDAACVVHQHPEDLCHFVGLADQVHGTQHHLVLERAWEDDDQDVALGMDTFYADCLHAAHGRHRGYGGITRAVLQPGGLSLHFDADWAQALGGMARLHVGFSLAPDAHAALHQALAAIFAGSDVLHLQG